MASVLAGTSVGLVRLDGPFGKFPGSGETGHARAGAPYAPELSGRSVSALGPGGSQRLWALVDQREIWRTDHDGGWQMVASLQDVPGDPDLVGQCLADTRANALGGILVGTSRARLVRVGEDGSLEVLKWFDAAPGREQWHTPWGGPPDCRTISEDADNVLVNVHVGGVLRSRDQGDSWEPTIDVDADVHRVVTGHGRVYAAGAYGLSVSEDSGRTWRLSDAGLHARYCRSVAVCGDTLLLSASIGPSGGRAALYRSGKEGYRFDRCRDGLPEWFEGNIDSLCLDALPDGALAGFGTKSGEIYVSTDQGATWARVAGGLDGIACVLTLP